MARILGDDFEQHPSACATPRALNIAGVRYANAAARFWAALLQEVAADYPGCDRLVFETLSAAQICRDLLFPELALQREVDRLHTAVSIGAALKEALQELELYGPPGAVRLQLLDSEREIKCCQLPLDCVDADIFAYLMAWLIEWAELPECLWNSAALEGSLTVQCAPCRLDFKINFVFHKDHVCEGLFRWRLDLALCAGSD